MDEPGVGITSQIVITLPLLPGYAAAGRRSSARDVDECLICNLLESEVEVRAAVFLWQDSKPLHLETAK